MTNSSLTIAAAVLLALAGVAPALANEDKQSIEECVKDNADQGQKAQVITAYCACMTEKMAVGEPLSVSEWEKSHPAEGKACSAAAGWN
jgi:hypothetical protein